MFAKEAIQDALAQIEHERDVRVLFACESGSRAWGFASEDSDYDGRFIYVHPTSWYVSIESHRDVIEAMLPGDLDLAGWDLRKALGLMRKSNPPLFEWIRSPIVYRSDDAFMAAFRALADQCFSTQRCFRHYLSMAKGNLRNYFDSDLVPLKKYLYVLRPLLACKWLEQGFGPAPMEFDLLVERVVDSSSVLEEIQRLLVAKKSGGEMGKGPKPPVLQAFVDAELARLSNVEWPSESMPPLEPLDAFFREAIGLSSTIGTS